MNIYETILLEYKRLQSEIRFCKEQLSQLPEGSLYSCKRKDSFTYRSSENGKTTYITADRMDHAIRLAHRMYYEHLLSDLENSFLAVSKFLKCYKENTTDDFLSSHTGISRLLSFSADTDSKDPGYTDTIYAPSLKLLENPIWTGKVSNNPEAYRIMLDHSSASADGILKWSYSGSNNAPFPEKRTIGTICGINVRSKSEALIANELTRFGLLFVYEPAIIIGQHIVYPDFYVFHPRDGIPVIIEHGGLLLDNNHYYDYSDEERYASVNYTRNFSNKIQSYMECGWIPGINLLITAENKYHSFNSAQLEGLIKTHLLN